MATVRTLPRRPKAPMHGSERIAYQAALRLGLQSALIVLAIVIALGAIVVGTVAASQSAARQRLLDDASHGLSAPSQAPAGIWLAILDNGTLTHSNSMPRGLPFLPDITAAAKNTEPIQRTLTVDGVKYVIRTQRAGQIITQAVYDGARDREQISTMLNAMLIAAVLSLIFAGLAGAALSRLALRPLQRGIRVQTAFISDASHELRTPLAVLSARAQLLSSALNSTAGTVSANSINDARLIVGDAKRLNETLSDLLQTANPTPEDMSGTVDVLSKLREAVAILSARASAREVEVIIQDPAQGLVVRGSEQSLLRAFVDILDNSLDFASDTVRIRIARRRSRLVITFSDDGPGFPGAERAPARRSADEADRVRHSNERHFGIGLALVSQIVETHGGKLTLRNDEGATVQLDLPLLN